MKKLLLINTNTERFPYPVPALGLNILAEFLKEKYSVKIYDAVFKGNSELENELIEFKPDYIGVSIRNVDDMVLADTKFYINEIKTDFIDLIRKNSKAEIILGGSGFSIFPKEVLEIFKTKYGVVGEGEQAFANLLDALDKEGSVKHLDAVVVRNESSSKQKENFSFQNLNHLPFSKIDTKTDFYKHSRRPVYSIQSKRGCYHECIYCTYPIIEGKSFRRRSASNIVDELEEVSKRLAGVTFEFVDSTFNDPPGHAEKICSEIIKRKLNIQLRTMGINPRHTSLELFELMKEAGFTQIDSTPDSASPQIIKNLKKGFELKHLVDTAEYIRKSELPVMWFFLFGAPGETEQTILESFDFIDKYIYKYDMVHLTGGLRIYPGTDLEKIAIAENLIDKNESLIHPKFYVPQGITHSQIEQILKKQASTRGNCIRAEDSTPSEELINKAISYRQKHKIDEPMFRTLLRVQG